MTDAPLISELNLKVLKRGSRYSEIALDIKADRILDDDDLTLLLWSMFHIRKTKGSGSTGWDNAEWRYYTCQVHTADIHYSR